MISEVHLQLYFAFKQNNFALFREMVDSFREIGYNDFAKAGA